MKLLEKLNTAQATYNELISNMNKFETTENFFDELGYSYDACLYYICHLLGLECDTVRYAYLDNAISDEYNWDEVYENIHEVE